MSAQYQIALVIVRGFSGAEIVSVEGVIGYSTASPCIDALSHIH